MNVVEAGIAAVLGDLDDVPVTVDGCAGSTRLRRFLAGLAALALLVHAT